MRKYLVGVILLLLLVGCGGTSSIDFTVEKAPLYKDGESYIMIIQATDDDGIVTGLDLVATLEMAKMDHGVIEVTFTDNNDGTYEGEVTLPMAGEWIADVKAELNGKTYEKVLTFDVKEG